MIIDVSKSSFYDKKRLYMKSYNSPKNPEDVSGCSLTVRVPARFEISCQPDRIFSGHGRDRKTIRIDRDPVFIFQPDPGFSGKIDSRFSF